MKTKLFAGLLASLLATVAQAQVYSIFSPGPSGPVKSNGSFALQTEVAADIIGLWSGTCLASTFLSGSGACANPVAGSNTQVQYNASGVFGASSLLTFTPGTVVLNVGAGTTPGTFSVGSLDTMVINGVTVPIPGFALNSNIQGVYENHSYVNGVAAGGARYYGVRSEGTISSPSIVVNGDHLSTWYAAGYNGTSYSLGASIMALVNGTPGASAMPTDLDFAVSPAGSQVPTSRLTLKTDGSYAVSGAVGSLGQFLRSGGAGAAAGWSGVSIPNAATLGDLWYGSATGVISTLSGNTTATKQFLTQTGTGAVSAAPAWGTIASTDLPGSFSGFANPSGLIGLTAANGVATTATRSDATHALDQSIAPTWTGAHTFSNTVNTNGSVVGNGATGGAKGAGTYNVQGLFVNNSPVLPTINCSAGGPCNISGMAVGQSAYIVTAAAQNQASNTTLTNDTELVFNNTPIGQYVGTFVASLAGPGAGGFKSAFVDATTIATGSLVCTSTANLINTQLGTGACSGNIPGNLTLSGVWIMTASGTMNFQWAQNAPSATNTTRNQGSSWTITRIQ